MQAARVHISTYTTLQSAARPNCAVQHILKTAHANKSGEFRHTPKKHIRHMTDQGKKKIILPHPLHDPNSTNVLPRTSCCQLCRTEKVAEPAASWNQVVLRPCKTFAPNNGSTGSRRSPSRHGRPAGHPPTRRRTGPWHCRSVRPIGKRRSATRGTTLWPQGPSCWAPTPHRRRSLPSCAPGQAAAAPRRTSTCWVRWEDARGRVRFSFCLGRV